MTSGGDGRQESSMRSGAAPTVATEAARGAGRPRPRRPYFVLRAIEAPGGRVVLRAEKPCQHRVLIADRAAILDIRVPPRAQCHWVGFSIREGRAEWV